MTSIMSIITDGFGASGIKERIGMSRKPAHPGRILRNFYLEPLSISISNLARALKVSRKTVSAIVNQKRKVTPDMALRLSKAFGTTAHFWLNLQKKHDLWEATHSNGDWDEIQPLYIAEEDA